jgi:hypothetical protein
LVFGPTESRLDFLAGGDATHELVRGVLGCPRHEFVDALGWSTATIGRRREPHDAVADRQPARHAVFEPLPEQHEPGPVPGQDFEGPLAIEPPKCPAVVIRARKAHAGVELAVSTVCLGRAPAGAVACAIRMH